MWGKNKLNKLKPCPFCGGKATFYTESSYPDEWTGILCSKCGFKTNAVWSIDEEIKKWNKRI